MIFTPNSNPTVIDISQETGVVTITQRPFGIDQLVSIDVSVDDLREFMASLEQSDN